MGDVTVELSYYAAPYTGVGRKPNVTAIAPDGRTLTRTGDGREYWMLYSDNIEVGTASVNLMAYTVSKYANLNEWRGNCAGSASVTFEVRPDVPTDVYYSRSGENAVISWKAAQTADLYVIYQQERGTSTWTEIGTTDELSYEVTDLDVSKNYRFKVGSRAYGREVVPYSEVDRTADGKRVITWEDQGIDAYDVYVSVYRSGQLSEFALVSTVNGTSYAHKPSNIDDTYIYRIAIPGERAYDSLTCTLATEQEMGIPEVTVSNITFTGKIRLDWTTVEGANRYEVYMSTSENGEYTKLYSTGVGRLLKHTSAKPGTTYYYKVRALNTTDGTVGEFSPVISRTCDLAQPVVETSNVAKTGKNRLTWGKIAGADRYIVYMSTSKDGTYTKLFTGTGTVLTHVSAKAEQRYYYKVQAIYDANADANSANSVTMTRACDLPIPTEISIGKSAAGKNLLTWSTVAGAEEYAVYMSTTEDGEYEMLYRTTGTTMTHTKGEAGVTYYYKVRALSGDNASAHSAYSAVYVGTSS